MTDIELQRSFYNKKWASFTQANAYELRRMATVLDYLCEVPTRQPYL